MRGCPHRGCKAAEEVMLLLPCGRPRAREVAPGVGAPPRECSVCSEESAAFTASLPDPLLLSFAFFFLPACFSQLLPWGAGLGAGGDCLPLQGSRVRAAASAPTRKWEGWRGDGKVGEPAQAEDEHSCPWRQSPALWFGADVACVALL